MDLCAAPGGWMQVARANMPVSSIVIGVDLFPIKTVPGCISLTEDITTDKCRIAITKELQTWKADVVLNDGAPNVGKNWLHDAYQQSVLTLSAVKLASEFLRPGGWFVTKVFRSKDYNALVWVLKQLFKKVCFLYHYFLCIKLFFFCLFYPFFLVQVHSTKPAASRNESAEIFIVCQYFIAPDKLDPKFFDPKYVFAELEIESASTLNVFHPEKKKKAKAEGYPENDYTLHPIMKVSEFISRENMIEAIVNTSEIIFDDDNILNHPKTTKEIQECCRDIKVLGTKDLRSLQKWHKLLHKEYHSSTVKAEDDDNNKENTDETKEVDEDNEEEKENTRIEEEIAALKAENAKELKRKKKKVNKERQKLNERLNLKMIHKGDEGPRLEGDDMFTMKEIKTFEQLAGATDQNPDILANSDDDSDDEKVHLPKRTKYEKDEGNLDNSGCYYKTEDSPSEHSDSEESDSDKSGLGLSDSEDDEKPLKSKNKKVTFDGSENPLITDLDVRDKKTKKIHKAELWYEKASLKDLEAENDADFELAKMAEIFKKKGGSIIGDVKAKKEEKEEEDNDDDDDNDGNNDDESGSDSDSDFDMNEFENSKKPTSNKKKVDDNDDFEVVSQKETRKKNNKRKIKLDEEGLAIGSLLVQSQKKRREITDGAWNRYMFNDPHALPDWFVKDEDNNMKQPEPVSKELVDEYKKNLEALNARPIKKVLEAKGRQKRRAMKKLEKAKKKVESLMDNTDISDREKAKQVRRLVFIYLFNFIFNILVLTKFL